MSSRTVILHAAARQDLADHVQWLRAEAGSEVADRFVTAVDQSFAALANDPGIGPNIGSRHPRLANVRKCRVAGFPKVLVFYEPLSDGIAVVRILHTAQDWWALLGVD